MESSLDNIINELHKKTQGHFNVALPLGLGKANNFINQLYKKAQSDTSISLNIYTALSLVKPKLPANEAAAHILSPILNPVYENCPVLQYEIDAQNGTLPENVKVYEFFYAPGSKLGNGKAQQDFFYSNYTHAARDILKQNINVIAQMVAADENMSHFSLSCNSDVTLELLTKKASSPQKIYCIAEINHNLPFMGGDACVESNQFDYVIKASSDDNQLFTLPQKPVSLTDYAIALRVSTCIEDGGSLQIGIGSLGDAIAASLYLRNSHNSIFQKMIVGLESSEHQQLREAKCFQTNIFKKGLYACTEMLVEGLVFLFEKNILKRQVYPLAGLNRILDEMDEESRHVIQPRLIQALLDQDVISLPLNASQLDTLQQIGILPEKLTINADFSLELDSLHFSQTKAHLIQLANQCAGKSLKSGVVCHAGFFLGSAHLYKTLQEFTAEAASQINMTAIGHVNQLYGQEMLKRDQRYKARFINSGMLLTLSGAVVSDRLDHAQIVSGVGGQYNFVAQAHELDNGRSIICVRSTRVANGKLVSNIVWQYSQTTIPAHLRDYVATEYGVADLRGASDRDVACKILNITDSRFQQSLLKEAKKHHKIEKNYQIPLAFQNNLPAILEKSLKEYSRYLPYFPLGMDFSSKDAIDLLSLSRIKDLQGFKKKMTYVFQHFNFKQLKQNHYKWQGQFSLFKPQNLLLMLLVSCAGVELEKKQRPLTFTEGYSC